MKKLFSFCLLAMLAIYASAQDLSSLYEKVDSSVVTIYVLETKNPGTGDPYLQTANEGLGSGVLVGEDGLYVLTASHVVDKASKIVVEFVDGSKIAAKTIRASKPADVALIQLDQPVRHISPAKIGDSDDVKIGQEVFIIGAPLGLTHSLSRGIISGKHQSKNLTDDFNRMEFFQTDAAINQGNSGGPMFNMDGEVIGIVSSILSFSGGFEGLGFAASINIAKDILLQRGSHWFGIDALPLNYELCKVFNVPQEGALLVQSVAEASPGYLMGLKGGYVQMSLGETEFLAGGDIILSFDDLTLDSQTQFEKLGKYLNELESGAQFTLKILRNGELKEIKWRLP